MPEEVSTEMMRKAVSESAVLQMFRRVPVGRAQTRFPVLSVLPVSYWVGGDTGLKQTSEINWTNKFLNIEEIAVIVPIPDNVVADVDVNIWGRARCRTCVEAFGRTLDSAVFFGTNAPGSFPTYMSAAGDLASASNTVTGNAAAAGQRRVLRRPRRRHTRSVEADGFDASGFVAATLPGKGKLRAAAVHSLGQTVSTATRTGPDLKTTIDGMPRSSYPMRGLFPTGSGGAGTNLRLVAGDWSPVRRWCIRSGHQR
jgi:hypothetical protein